MFELNLAILKTTYFKESKTCFEKFVKKLKLSKIKFEVCFN